MARRPRRAEIDRMEVLTWVAVAVAAVALAFVLWLRRGVNAYRRSFRSVVEGILTLRRMAGRMPSYVPLAPGSPDAASLAEAEPGLKASDLHQVGDVQELGPDGKPVGAMRWFVSGAGAVFGWVGVTPTGPVMLLMSEIPGAGFVTTLRSPAAPSTSTPDTVVRQRLEWGEGLASALARHAAAVGAMGEPVAVEGLEGALRGMRALKAHVAEWRAAQDPAGLLEADVRQILGAHFDAMGEAAMHLVRLEERQAG